ncbi:Imm26 family immunity protein [Chryseobacterium sp. ERMR1:04]|uniref:Imm26 family immunity protein n=1 Tax=Chryseobacterium sp. ERMR1:04 TaxID=1705393 RepID=UPI0006C8BB83|nr:Imm26 family immunity protein [Chryseobacterium sp. ERMR1:04]KPH13341.1 hypothetical protein AMQ68_12890 [Chryseobacterium sp. ERMR1:04]
MAKRFKLSEGDIFTIPLGNGEFGIGQIVCFPRTKDVFIMIVYDYRAKKYDENNIMLALKSSILFLGYSTEARLYHKMWEIIENSTKNLDEVKMPYHRLGTPPEEIYLTNYKNERIKAINEKEFQRLEYLTSYAPIRFENALKAHFGLQEWISENYDSVLYEKTLESIRVANELLNIDGDIKK